MCVNYKIFNILIIKNCNTLSFIKKNLTCLCLIKIYNKFDIIAIFNKIKIKKNNEHKIVFFIQYKLFEYIIMLFELYNVFDIF